MLFLVSLSEQISFLTILNKRIKIYRAINEVENLFFIEFVCVTKARVLTFRRSDSLTPRLTFTCSST